jgi:hypothetical protein
MKRKPVHNSGLAKVAVQCSAESFVVNQTLVLRINICGKNRHLRQAANWAIFWPKTTDKNLNKNYYEKSIENFCIDVHICKLF